MVGEGAITTIDAYEAELAFDPNGNLLVVWSEIVGSVDTPCRARIYDAGGTPLGPPFAVDAAKTGSRPRVAGAAGEGFVVLWLGVSGAEATVLSLCSPGMATCGDGVWDSRCDNAMTERRTATSSRMRARARFGPVSLARGGSFSRQRGGVPLSVRASRMVKPPSARTATVRTTHRSAVSRLPPLSRRARAL